ncbi:MAG TPA: serine/threonine-protein kinase [Kofleriaceae bacterium]|nr:serine/threonine-protein kinase [Kofleriaceae bacterium]
MIGQTIGSYRILSQLGEGGMGTVFRATHVETGAAAAVKVLLSELSGNDQIVRRFFNEAKAIKMIEHPGIPVIYDFGLHEGRAYIVMELLAGQDLNHHLFHQKKLPVAEVVELTRQFAEVLAAAHEHKIVHRDLKPDNIFVVPDATKPGGARVMLLDFGIAKLAPEDAGVATRTGMVLGTPAYMAPEQCLGAKKADHRTDLYAMGCIMFHMLTGRPPFEGNGPGQIMTAHIATPAPSVRSLEPMVPDVISVLIANLLEKDPDKRPQSAREVRATLDGDPAASTLVPASGMMSPFRASAAQAPSPVNTPVPLTTPAPVSGPHHAPQSPVTGTTESRAVPRKRGLLIGGAVLGGIAAVVAAVVLLAGGDQSAEDACKAGDAAQCVAVAAGLERRTPADTEGAGAYYTMACAKGDPASCRRADELACARARAEANPAGWKRYLTEHAEGSCAAEARARIEPPPPPSPLEAMRDTAARVAHASPDALRALTAAMTKALRELAPELTWEPTRLVVLSDTASVGDINDALAREDTIVYLEPGRYVLTESVVLDGAKNVVLASDGGAVLVSAGQPPVRVAESESALLFGIYVTRIAPALPDPRRRRPPPYLLEIDGSSAVSLRRLELECNGGAGMIARNASVRLHQSVIYHCGAPALEVDSGETRAENLALFGVGARDSTIVSVGRDAAVTLDRLTLVAPEAGARAKAITVAGALTMAHALVVHPGRPLYRAHRGAELTLGDSCFTGAALERGVDGSNLLLAQPLVAKSAGQAGWFRYALDTSAACRSFGARMPAQVVPKRSRRE